MIGVQHPLSSYSGVLFINERRSNTVGKTGSRGLGGGVASASVTTGGAGRATTSPNSHRAQKARQSEA